MMKIERIRYQMEMKLIFLAQKWKLKLEQTRVILEVKPNLWLIQASQSFALDFAFLSLNLSKIFRNHASKMQYFLW